MDLNNLSVDKIFTSVICTTVLNWANKLMTIVLLNSEKYFYYTKGSDHHIKESLKVKF